MAITAAFDLEAWQLDAVSAFTNSLLDEIVHCDFPDGFGQDGSCILLLRALYGLSRSPLLWLRELSHTLRDLGLTQVGEDLCLFTNDYLVVFFYVDDIVLLSRTKDLQKLEQFRETLMNQYEMRDYGELSWFLGIRVIRDRPNRKLWLCQDSYISKIAKTFHLTDRKLPHTPMTTEDLLSYDGQAKPQEIYAYQRKVGSLLYATTISRPDATRTASKLSEFLQNPSPSHHDAVDRAITYLYGTRTYAVEYSGEINAQNVFICASDAAYADDTATRRSTEGYLFQLFGGPIDWRSTKQKTVTTSTTEAELLALSHASKETLWWKRLFESLQLDPGHDITISCDNEQTVGLLSKTAPQYTTKLRHVDIHRHWLRQEVQDRRIRINWVSTTNMRADGLTKALPRQRHETFIRQLGLVDIGGKLVDTASTPASSEAGGVCRKA